MRAAESNSVYKLTQDQEMEHLIKEPKKDLAELFL